LLSEQEIAALIDTIHQRSRGQSRLASGAAANNVDSSQINCTFYDAVGRRNAEYLIARAIQCFVPGIPQIYYVGLFTGNNDLDLLRRTGIGRVINRHYYTSSELHRDLARPVVQSQLDLLRLRNTHPAFAGTFHAPSSSPDRVALEWRKSGDFARLDVDLSRMVAAVTCSGPEAGVARSLTWRTPVEA
jgi:sucrose phosphorylase